MGLIPINSHRAVIVASTRPTCERARFFPDLRNKKAIRNPCQLLTLGGGGFFF